MSDSTRSPKRRQRARPYQRISWHFHDIDVHPPAALATFQVASRPPARSARRGALRPPRRSRSSAGPRPRPHHARCVTACETGESPSVGTALAFALDPPRRPQHPVDEEVVHEAAGREHRLPREVLRDDPPRGRRGRAGRCRTRRGSAPAPGRRGPGAARRAGRRAPCPGSSRKVTSRGRRSLERRLEPRQPGPVLHVASPTPARRRRGSAGQIASSDGSVSSARPVHDSSVAYLRLAARRPRHRGAEPGRAAGRSRAALPSGLDVVGPMPRSTRRRPELPRRQRPVDEQLADRGAELRRLDAAHPTPERAAVRALDRRAGRAGAARGRRAPSPGAPSRASA